MIPFHYITERRAETPWTMGAQVEQDPILSHAVVSMFAKSELADPLGCRGGTALCKLHIRPAARYSEDIGLVAGYGQVIQDQAMIEYGVEALRSIEEKT